MIVEVTPETGDSVTLPEGGVVYITHLYGRTGQANTWIARCSDNITRYIRAVVDNTYLAGGAPP